MKRKTFFGATLLAGVVFSSGFVLGQNAQTDLNQDFDREVEAATDDLDSGLREERKAGARATEEAANKAVGNLAFTRTLARDALQGIYTGDDPKAAAKIQTLQIAQNQRIVELLEKIAAKENAK